MPRFIHAAEYAALAAMNSEPGNACSSAGEPGEPSPDILPAEAPGPFFERCDWLAFGVTAVLMFAVYLRTLAPEVTLEYSGLLATAADYAGVPHPPGFPVWTLYAWLFAHLLPCGNVAWRVAVSSAFAGALACGVIALVVAGTGQWMFEVEGPRRQPPHVERQLRVLAGVIAGTLFGLSGSVWAQAVVVENWTLGLLLLSLVVCLLAVWSHAPERRRCLYGAWLVFGMASATNQGLAVAMLGLGIVILFVDPALGRDFLFAMALAIVVAFLAHCLSLTWTHAGRLKGLTWTGYEPVWRGVIFVGAAAAVACAIGIWRTCGLLSHWKTVLGAALGLALGLAVYLYPPIASMTNPPVNWGYARTVEGFFHLVSRGQYERLDPVHEVATFSDQTIRFGLAAARDYGVMACLLALVPFCFLRRLPPRGRCWMLGLLALFLCLSWFLLAMMNPSVDAISSSIVKPYFSLSFIVLAMWTGYGVLRLGMLMAREQRG
jgi:hypothetical protein